MIALEALQAWHKGVHTFLQKEFPGLRVRCENRLNAAAMRWEFVTTIWPPDSKPGYLGGYFTLDQLEKEQDIVLNMMAEYPQVIKKEIKERLEANLSNRKST